MKVTNHGQPGRGRRIAAPMAEINIIPLVDVTLVLLIIFMVTTAFVTGEDKGPAKPERELDLKLPYSAAAIENPQATEPFVIAVDKSGKKYLGVEPVTTATLVERVKAAAAQHPDQHIRIDADRETRFQDIVEIIELCQFEGLKNVGLHTAPDRP
jgi:biopolymer transport protein ExbD